MRSDAQGKALTSERYDYIMGEQLKNRPEYRYFWNDQTVPVLPPQGRRRARRRRDAAATRRSPARRRRSHRPLVPPPPPVDATPPRHDRAHRRNDRASAAGFDGATFAAQIPYTFARTHGVLAAGEEGDAVVVLMRPDATADGIIEIRRVLQRPLVTRAIGAEEFAFELARAYNQGRRPTRCWSAISRARTISRASCRTCRSPRICSTARRRRR